MKIFDEYWLSLGEDSNKVKRLKKKRAREIAAKKVVEDREREVRTNVLYLRSQKNMFTAALYICAMLYYTDAHVVYVFRLVV